MVGLIEGYNMWKFQIDISQIEARTSVFVQWKFFRIFIKIRNIEICNRLLWVCWYNGNSTYPPYLNAEWPSSVQYDLIKQRERLAIWQIGKYFSMISYHSKGLLRISIISIPPFSSSKKDIGTYGLRLWMKPLGRNRFPTKIQDQHHLQHLLPSENEKSAICPHLS